MEAVAKEKEAAMGRCRRLHRLRTLLRCLEAIGFLLLVLWSSLRLPAAARLSGDLVRRLAVVLFSPGAVFFVGNSIVVLLIYKSGQLSSASKPDDASSPAVGSDDASAGSDDASAGSGDIYEEYFFEARGKNRFYLHAEVAQASTEDEEVKEKAVVYEDMPVRSGARRRECRRIRSEKIHRQSKVDPELRRTDTDVGRKGERRPPLPEDVTDVEEVDDEEFRRTVEEFIAKQTRFRREESLAAGAAGSIGSPGRGTTN